MGYKHCIGNTWILNIAVIKSWFIFIYHLFFEIIDIIWSTRTNHIISNYYSSFSHTTCFLNQFEIRKIMLLIMVNKDKIKSSMLFEKRYILLHSSKMKMNPFANPCKLMNLLSNTNTILTYLNTMQLWIFRRIMN